MKAQIRCICGACWDVIYNGETSLDNEYECYMCKTKWTLKEILANGFVYGESDWNDHD